MSKKRDRNMPDARDIAKALYEATHPNNQQQAPEGRNVIIHEKWMDYPMVGYTNGHHFGTSNKKYKNYTEAITFKLENLKDPRKFTILQGAFNNIKRIHKKDGTLNHIKKELKELDALMIDKARTFDMNPGLAELLQYGEDLTKKALAGELDDCVGRKKEIDQLMLMLGKRKKANPILTGKAGVGKTQIVHGLANKIAKNEAGWLNTYSIVELSPTDLVSGTKFVGSLQEKMKKIISAIKECPNVIIFTDEIHNLMGTGKGINGTQDLANILKPVLADGTMKMIGATTEDEFKIITKDPAMERRFINIEVKEMSVDSCKELMLGVADSYATYHALDYTNEALVLMPILAKRYAGRSKALPDSAFDLLDMCGATAKIEGVLDIDVGFLMKVASKLYNEPVDEIITTELSSRELSNRIGFI